MRLSKLNLIIGIIISICVLAGIVLTVDGYFAKSDNVEKMFVKVAEGHRRLEANDLLGQERLDVSITDDQIFQQEQHIQQMKNFHIFEQKEEISEFTAMEKEALEGAEDRLSILKKTREDKIKRYEEMKKSEVSTNGYHMR